MRQTSRLENASRWSWALVFTLYSTVLAEELRIDTRAEWDEWDRPGDAIDTGPDQVQPRFVRRDIDAVANADSHGGGIHSAGSNEAHAP